MIVTIIEKKKKPIGQVIRHLLSRLLSIIGFFALVMSIFLYIYAFFDKGVTVQEIYTVNFVVSSIAVSREILSKWSKESLLALFYILVNLILFNPFTPINWGSFNNFILLIYFIYSLSLYYEMLGLDE